VGEPASSGKEIKLYCSSCDDDKPLSAFSRDSTAPSRFYRMWTCKDCKAARVTSGRGNGMKPRENTSRMSQVEQAINEIIASGSELSGRGVARHMGRNSDHGIRRDWDTLAAQGRVPPRPRATTATPSRQAELEKDRNRHATKKAARKAAEQAELEQLRATHEAIGGAVATAITPQARDRRNEVSAAITKCIVAVSRALQEPGFYPELAAAESALVADEFRLHAAAQRLIDLLDKIPDTKQLNGGNNPSGAPAKWKDPELVSAVRQRVLTTQPLTGLAITFGVSPGTVERTAIYVRGLIEAEQAGTSFPIQFGDSPVGE
jgi:hypothetical protein